LRVGASCRLGQAHHALGSYDRAAELFRQIVASIQGDLVQERFGMAALASVWARSWLAWTLAELGDFDEATRVAEEAAEIAATGDHPYSRIQACWGLGTVYLIQGRLDRAVPALEQGLVSARLESISFFVPFITAPLGAAYALGGRVENGITLLEQSVEQAASMRLVAHQSLRLAWLAWSELLAGRHESALGHARRALDIAEDRQERGQQVRVRRLLADIEAGSETPEVPEAEAAYRAALDQAESLQMRPLAAQCLLGLGGLHRRAGRDAQARVELDEALARFSAMGMALWIERTRSEVDAIR
jgi:tetratricopeptide (TPR) repeat protein